MTQEQLNSITTFGINNHSNWKGVKDWSGLNHLKNLTELDVYGEDGFIYSLEELSGLTKLKTLHIAFATVSGDFDSIVSFQNLENLDLSAVIFSEAATCALPKSLRKLQLHAVDNVKGSIEVLSGMEGLEEVWLVDVGMVGSISSFSNLTQIKRIILSEMEVTGDLSSFSMLGSLEYLDISSTGCGGNVSTLANLKNLRHLALSSNEPEETEKGIGFSGNLSSLASLSNLEELYLRHINLKGDISDLLPLTKLSTLDLSMDFTGDISAIASFRYLKNVDLRSTCATCTLNEDFLELTKLEQFSTTHIDYEGDLSILGRLPACYNLSIYYPTINLPEIEFVTDDPIEVSVPRIAADRMLVPQNLNSNYGIYADGKITWNVPKGRVDQSGGRYSYYISQYSEEYNPYSCFTFCGTIIQPYKKPRTIVEGNIGASGYSSITGLDSGKRYAISNDALDGGISVKHRIEADGTVGAQITDADRYEDMPVLVQNKIINLENYKVYTVYELSEEDFIPTPTPTPVPQPGEDGIFEFGGHRYKVLTGEYTWDEAEEKCREMGGHLVTITSGEEQAFIESINTSELCLWIGGYRDESFNWYWVTDERWDYTNWGDDEPNNLWEEGEDCAAIWPRQWNDLNRNNTAEQSGFVCEWEPEPDPNYGNSREEVISAIGYSPKDIYRAGDQGIVVMFIQTALKELIGYDGEITGVFCGWTEGAVKKFQSRYGLPETGVCDAATMDKLIGAYVGGVPKKYGRNFYNPEWDSAQDWLEEIGLKKGAVALLSDLRTDTTFRISVQEMGGHIEAEPLTAADTRALCRAYGVASAEEIVKQNLYKRRPMLLTAVCGDEEYQIVCSLYGVPHGAQTISDNRYDGAFCLHLTGSKFHGRDEVCTEHAAAIAEAMEIMRKIVKEQLTVSGQKMLKLPDSLRAVDSEAFAGVAADEVVIAEGCLSIGSRAFAGCEALVRVEIPDSVTAIAEDAFEGCSTLIIAAPKGSTAQEYALSRCLIWEDAAESGAAF